MLLCESGAEFQSRSGGKTAGAPWSPLCPWRTGEGPELSGQSHWDGQRGDLARLAFEKDHSRKVEDIKIEDPEAIGAEWVRQGLWHQVMWA